METNELRCQARLAQAQLPARREVETPGRRQIRSGDLCGHEIRRKQGVSSRPSAADLKVLERGPG